MDSNYFSNPLTPAEQRQFFESLLQEFITTKSLTITPTFGRVIYSYASRVLTLTSKYVIDTKWISQNEK